MLLKTTTADELTGETNAVSARETSESTADTEIATAIDTDSNEPFNIKPSKQQQ